MSGLMEEFLKQRIAFIVIVQDGAQLTSSPIFVAVFEWKHQKLSPEIICCLLDKMASSWMYVFCVTQTPCSVTGRSLEDGGA